MHGEIVHISMWHLQARKLEVALVDTTGDDDVHINDVLVSEGLAEYKTNRPPSPLPPQPKRVTVTEQLMKFTFK
jgi:hypothetical protein